jgi:hypothetical protein
MGECGFGFDNLESSIWKGGMRGIYFRKIPPAFPFSE